MVVAAQLHDADGNTIFETSQLALEITISSAAGATTTCPCSVVSGSGLASCSCAVPPAWFSDMASSTAGATLTLSYGGALRLTREIAGGVTLHRSPTHPAAALTASGMALHLPTSPRFGGDAFTARVSASLIGADYGLRAWTVRLEYDTALLSLQVRSRRRRSFADDPLTTHYALRTTHHALLTAHHSPLTTHHSPLTTHHSPLTTRHSPLATHHSPLTTDCSLTPSTASGATPTSSSRTACSR